MTYIATYVLNGIEKRVESESAEEGFETACQMFKEGYQLTSIERQDDETMTEDR